MTIRQVTAKFFITDGKVRTDTHEAWAQYAIWFKDVRDRYPELIDEMIRLRPVDEQASITATLKVVGGEVEEVLALHYYADGTDEGSTTAYTSTDEELFFLDGTAEAYAALIKQFQRYDKNLVRVIPALLRGIACFDAGFGVRVQHKVLCTGKTTLTLTKLIEPMSKPTDSYCTPRWLTDAIGAVDLDPCSNFSSTVQAAVRCTGFETYAEPQPHAEGFSWKPVDGLKVSEWRTADTIFIHPPYSKVLPWAERAVKAAAGGAEVLMLIKLDPSTKWWAELAKQREGVDVLWWPFTKRLAFEIGGVPQAGDNFCSALVYLAPSEKSIDELVLLPRIQALIDGGFLWR